MVVILICIGVLAGIYYGYFRTMPSTDPGTAPTQAISLTGVRGDLLQIGQAERGFISLNGKCASLDELISSGSLAMNRSGRDGYSYSLECSGNDFRVTARHPEAPAGSPIRYPTLSADSSLQITEIQ